MNSIVAFPDRFRFWLRFRLDPALSSFLSCGLHAFQGFDTAGAEIVTNITVTVSCRILA